MDVLKKTEGSRVVTQSSSANWFGSFNWDDINAEKGYSRWHQYAKTKLANIAFANELNRRTKSSGNSYPKCFSVHPGLVVGQLQENSAEGNKLDHVIYKITSYLAGTYETRALPALYACTSPNADTDNFYGPNGFMEECLAENILRLLRRTSSRQMRTK